MPFFSPRFLAGALAALLAPLAIAHGVVVGELSIEHPYATPSIPGARAGAAYLRQMRSAGPQGDTLRGASSPLAQSVEIHTMSVDKEGVMRMRELTLLRVEPGKPVSMAPGMGIHLMLMDLKRPLKEGESFPMTLEFDRAGKVEVLVVVQRPGATRARGMTMENGHSGKAHSMEPRDLPQEESADPP